MMKKLDPNICPTSKHSGFYTAQDNLDTVVFVHGLRGHFHRTWGEFPALLISDPNLPNLDIYLWGFKTGVVRPLVNGSKTIGGDLISDLASRMQSDNVLHVVGHSMGGLIILEGIIDEMIAQRALQLPARSIKFISLFASPVSGSTAAMIAKQTVGRLWIVQRIVNRQIASLARGQAIDDLLTEVMHRIYMPAKEDSAAQTIPIRMVMARNDAAVSDTDRQRISARYRKLAPYEFDYGHSGIKEPRDHYDQRYNALTKDLHDVLADRFHQICLDLNSKDSETKDRALGELSRRYERIFRRRLEDAGVVIDEKPALYKSYLRVIVADCRQCPRPPFYAADRAVTILKERGELER